MRCNFFHSGRQRSPQRTGLGQLGKFHRNEGLNRGERAGAGAITHDLGANCSERVRAIAAGPHHRVGPERCWWCEEWHPCGAKSSTTARKTAFPRAAASPADRCLSVADIERWEKGWRARARRMRDDEPEV